jgi:putative phosphoesterase
VTQALNDCDLIFHAGDISRSWVLERLREIAPVWAVIGNNDDDDELLKSLPVMRRFQMGQHRVGLIHGHTPLSKKRQTARQVAIEQGSGQFDCMIFGHSHKAEDTVVDGLRIVNPGSATWPRWQPAPSFAVVDVAESIDVAIVYF